MAANIETKLLRTFDGVSTIAAGTGMFTSCSSSTGNFMLFTIDDSGGVFLIQVASQQVTSPYTYTPLCDDTFLLKYTAVTICAIQDKTGSPLLGAVFKLKNDANSFEFFSCQNFGALTEGEEQWSSHGTIKGNSISGLSAGKSKKGLPILLAQVKIDNDVRIFYFDGSQTGAVETPLGSDGIIRAEISNNAKLSSIDGIEFLGLSLQKPSNQGALLTATSIPDREYYNHTIPIDADTSAITVTDGISDSSLFVAGSNIYYYPPAAQINRNTANVLKQRVKINSTDFTLDHPIDLQGTKDGNNLHHLWILQQNGLLAYTYENENNLFSEPFNLCANISSFASHTDPSGLVHLFTLSANSELRHHIMDRNKNWSDNLIQIPRSEKIEEVTACVTTIVFDSNDKFPDIPNDANFSISSSAPTVVKINGIAYILDSFQYLSIPWASNGVFTITQRVNGTSIERLKINSNLFLNPIELNPAILIAKRLSTVKGDDLKNGIIVDAKSNTNPSEVLVGADNHQYCNDAAENFRLLSDQLLKLSSGGTSPNSVEDNPKFSIKGGAVNGGLIIYSDSPKAGSFAAPNTKAAEGHSGQLQESEESTSSTGVFGWIVKSIKEGVVAISKFIVKVVDGIVNVIIKIGKTIYNLLAPILDPIFSAIEWVWDKIKVGVSTAVKWIAEVIGFDDILNTSRHLKRTFNNFIDVFSNQLLPKLANVSNGFFKKMEEFFVDDADWIDTNMPINTHGSGGDKNYLSNPKMAIALEVANPAVSSNGSIDGPLHEPTSDFRDLLITIDSIFRDLSDVVPNLKQAWDKCKNGSDVMGIFKFLGVALLELCRTAVSGIIKATAAASQLIKIILNSSASLPIIGPLYKLLTGDTVSALDVLCFLAAFPVTLICKAMTGHAPFQESSPLDDRIYQENISSFMSSGIDSFSSPDENLNLHADMLMVSQDAPMLMASLDTPMLMVSQDTPMLMINHDTPMLMASQDTPMLMANHYTPMFMASHDTDSPPLMSDSERDMFKTLCRAGEACSLFATLWVPFNALAEGEGGLGIFPYIGTGLTALNYILKFVAYFYIYSELTIVSKLVGQGALLIGLALSLYVIYLFKTKVGKSVFTKVKGGIMSIVALIFFVCNIIHWATTDKKQETKFGWQVTGGCCGFVSSLSINFGAAFIKELPTVSPIVLGVGVLLRLATGVIAFDIISSNADNIKHKRYLPLLP